MPNSSHVHIIVFIGISLVCVCRGDPREFLSSESKIDFFVRYNNTLCVCMRNGCVSASENRNNMIFILVSLPNMYYTVIVQKHIFAIEGARFWFYFMDAFSFSLNFIRDILWVKSIYFF